MEQAASFTLDLAAQQHVDVELDARVFERLILALPDFADRRADGFRHFVKAFGRPDGAAFIGVHQMLFDRLADGQIARRQQHHHPVAGFLEHRHLAESADVVHTGVGAAVGQHHQAGVEFDGYAVGHVPNGWK